MGWSFKNQWPERIGFVNLKPTYRAVWLYFAAGVRADGKILWCRPVMRTVAISKGQ